MVHTAYRIVLLGLAVFAIGVIADVENETRIASYVLMRQERREEAREAQMVELRRAEQQAQMPGALPASPVQLIDVARGAPVGVLFDALRLTPTERVVSVDDVPLTCDLDLPAFLELSGGVASRSGHYLDLRIRDVAAAQDRRALMLLH